MIIMVPSTPNHSAILWNTSIKDNWSIYTDYSNLKSSGWWLILILTGVPHMNHKPEVFPYKASMSHHQQYHNAGLNFSSCQIINTWRGEQWRILAKNCLEEIFFFFFLIKEIVQSGTEWTFPEFSFCSAEHLTKYLLISNLICSSVFKKS